MSDRILSSVMDHVYTVFKSPRHHIMPVLKRNSQSINPNKFLILREAIEKSLKAMVGKDLSSKGAYQIALQVEKAAVAAKKLKWNIDYGPKISGFLGEAENHEQFLHAIRVILNKFSPNKIYQVPYVAGYDVAGKMIYIDRSVAKAQYSGFTSDDFLVIHEVMEKSLLMQNIGLHYQEAHQCALRAEKATVDISGNNWDLYDHLMQGYIDFIYRLPEFVPPQLDLTPYRDEDDSDYVIRIEELQKSHR
ncbi:MAG: hypothetical protein PHY93_11390 [Bacteriovorax sp.]|nr:hypothetical protein [Bacteriovorax sp.]